MMLILKKIRRKDIHEERWKGGLNAQEQACFRSVTNTISSSILHFNHVEEA
jgi:hypothetical protein